MLEEKSILHPDVQELDRVMRAIEDLLRTGHDTGWAQQVARCAELVEKSDAYGLDRFLNLFGGMGSINDVVLYRDGVPLTEENDRLHRLLSEASAMARCLRP